MAQVSLQVNGESRTVDVWPDSSLPELEARTVIRRGVIPTPQQRESVPKVNGRDFVTGSRNHTSDIRKPKMLYRKVIRPAHYGVTGGALDSIAAEKMPGTASSSSPPARTTHLVNAIFAATGDRLRALPLFGIPSTVDGSGTN